MRGFSPARFAHCGALTFIPLDRASAMSNLIRAQTQAVLRGRHSPSRPLPSGGRMTAGTVRVRSKT